MVLLLLLLLGVGRGRCRGTIPCSGACSRWRGRRHCCSSYSRYGTSTGGVLACLRDQTVNHFARRHMYDVCVCVQSTERDAARGVYYKLSQRNFRVNGSRRAEVAQIVTTPSTALVHESHTQVKLMMTGVCRCGREHDRASPRVRPFSVPTARPRRMSK